MIFVLFLLMLTPLMFIAIYVASNVYLFRNTPERWRPIIPAVVMIMAIVIVGIIGAMMDSIGMHCPEWIWDALLYGAPILYVVAVVVTFRGTGMVLKAFIPIIASIVLTTAVMYYPFKWALGKEAEEYAEDRKRGIYGMGLYE